MAPPGPGADGAQPVSAGQGHPGASRRINEIVHGTRAVTADTALRLARYFGTSERFWLNLQAPNDLDTEHDRVGERIQREVTPRAG